MLPGIDVAVFPLNSVTGELSFLFQVLWSTRRSARFSLLALLLDESSQAGSSLGLPVGLRYGGTKYRTWIGVATMEHVDRKLKRQDRGESR